MLNDYHWYDELPIEILKDEKTLDFLKRLNMQTHVCAAREAIVRRAAEH